MPKLVSFCLPLIFSGTLQLLFNAVDLIVVGRFTGSTALAAVGANSALINIFVTLFIGVSLGSNVCAARYYAAKDYKRMTQTVHTSILAAAIFGLALLVLGQFLGHFMLTLLGTPEDVLPLSLLYLRIYFLGSPFFMVYNFGAAILRAVGDTKRPMIFLIIAGILNAVLNVVLVVCFSLGVAGVAIATVFSQMVSCLLVIRVLLRSPENYRLYPQQLSITPPVFRQILLIGIPAGLQTMIISVSNAMLQSSVNSFGSDAMAGYTAANNILGFLYASANGISQGCMSFTSQNLGAGKAKRIRDTLILSLFLEFVVTFTLGCLSYFFGRNILSVYSDSEAVIAHGMSVLSLTTTTYFLCGFMDCIPGSLRGMGHSIISMILSVIGTVGFRIFWICLIFPLHHDIRFLFICYPGSWLLTILMQVVCHRIVYRKVCRQMRAI